MKFVQVPMGTPTKTLVEVRKGLIEEFKKPKSEGKYITELKEIKQYPNETVWDFDQRIKTLMERIHFEMSNIQHKELFIAVLLTQIRLPLMHQKITTHSEALEISMKMEAYPIGENTVSMSRI